MALAMLSFLCLLILIFTSQATASTLLRTSCGTAFTTTPGTIVNILLSNLSSHKEIDYGFYNFSSGGLSTIGLCRGDVKPDDCRQCLSDSSTILTNKCPERNEAIVWFDICMARYSNRPILGVLDTSPSFTSCTTTGNTLFANRSYQEFNDLLDRLKTRAATGDSRRKFATGNVLSKYALAQCTPDLSEAECTGCFNSSFPRFEQTCGGRDSGYALSPSCSIIFDSYRFYADTPSSASPPGLPPSPPSLSPPPPPPLPSGKSHTILAVVLAIVAVAVFLMLIFIGLRVRKQRNPTKYHQRQLKTDFDIDAAYDPWKLDFKSVRDATENFSDANKLGQGGSGTVYKGKLPDDGPEVAVKKLFKTSMQKLKNEVPVAKLHHPNVVKLVGYCKEKNEGLLVYEYIPHCLSDFIYGDQIKRADLNWEKRYKIIVGIARGFVYLHEEYSQQIIHCDLKPSNILLDEEMNPTISDFGTARWLEDNQTNKGHTENIFGTRGYMAPEYENDGRYSTKSDVYSFGMLVLELICGQKNKGTQEGKEQDLLNYAMTNWKKNTPLKIVDKAIDSTLICGPERDEISRCIQIGLLCVQKDVVARPTMREIFQWLDDFAITLRVPSDPVLEVTMTG